MGDFPERSSLEQIIKWNVFDPDKDPELFTIFRDNAAISVFPKNIIRNQEDGTHLHADDIEVLEPSALPIILLTKGYNYDDEYLIYGKSMSATSRLAILSIGIDFQPSTGNIQRDLLRYITNKTIQYPPLEDFHYQRPGGDYQIDSPILNKDFLKHDPKQEIVIRTPEYIITRLINESRKNGHTPICVLSPSTITLQIKSMELKGLGIPIYTYEFNQEEKPHPEIKDEVTGFWEP